SFIEEARADAGHALRREFDRFVLGFVDRLRASPEYAARAEAMKQELLQRPEIAGLADGAWDRLRSFLEQDAARSESQLGRPLAAILADIHRPTARADPIRPA